MEKIELKRKFVLEKGTQKITLTDPNRSLSTDEVMAFYSGTYPELVNCSVHGPAYEGDTVIYTFKTTVGTKG